jgi:hypothetical protein
MQTQNETPNWYACITDIDLAGTTIELGKGLVLSPAYVHVMAHAMLAFKRPEAGKPHPGPWVGVPGGFSLEASAQLYVPGTYKRAKTVNYNVVRRLVGLMRMWVPPTIQLAFVSQVHFEEIPAEAQRSGVAALSLETEMLRLRVNTSIDHSPAELIEWVRKYWETTLDLAEQHASFELALEAIDQVWFMKSKPLALVALWGALEALFTGQKSELRFRVSSMLAAYLEPAGPARAALQKAAAKLYDARSSAAHGSNDHSDKEWLDSYELLRRAIVRMVEERKVPTIRDLEALLFGG